MTRRAAFIDRSHRPARRLRHRLRLLGLAALVSGCSAAPTRRTAAPVDPVLSEDEGGILAHLYGELQDDILTSYERDEPPDLDSGMIDPKIGTARIGAGPTDVWLAGEPASRWPLTLERSTRAEIRSKQLQIQLAVDQNAAWMSDELSWRITLCDRTAVIPLRITALYAHDGDRWVPVFEHVSFGWPASPGDAPLPKSIKTEVISGDLRDELSGVLGRGLFRLPHDPSVVAQDPLAMVLGPDAGDEWHGPHVLEAGLPPGKLEDRRVGLVGRDPATATVAYWVGSFVADVPARPGGAAGKVKMRVTHVFEKRHTQTQTSDSCAPARDAGKPGKPGKDAKSGKDAARHASDNADCRWVLVQSHMSQPITDDELTRRVFGTALMATNPLALDCSAGHATAATMPAARPATAPAAAPRRTVPATPAPAPPAARTP